MQFGHVAAVATGIKAFFLSKGRPMAASKTSVATSGAALAHEDPVPSSSAHAANRPGRRAADRGTSPDWVDVGIVF